MQVKSLQDDTSAAPPERGLMWRGQPTSASVATVSLFLPSSEILSTTGPALSNRIVPLDSHVRAGSPGGFTESARTTVVPPRSGCFRSSAPARYTTQRPSGEKAGATAPSIPEIRSASARSWRFHQ